MLQFILAAFEVSMKAATLCIVITRMYQALLIIELVSSTMSGLVSTTYPCMEVLLLHVLYVSQIFICSCQQLDVFLKRYFLLLAN